MSPRAVIAALVGVLVAFGVGWLLGASGRSIVELERVQLERRAEVLQARSHVLAARVSLFQANFGEARRSLLAAAGLVQRAQSALRESGQAERAGRLEIVLAHLRDADRLAGELNAGAQDAAVQAIDTLDAALPAE
jgi:hypothetical protein